MRIYLDNCIFQDLKKEEHGNLLQLIKEDKKRNLYCFSEAHLYDLSRDKSDEKYKDMDFMESIAEANCWYFENQRTTFKSLTPKSYYDSFDWTPVVEFFSDDATLSLCTIFEAIPLNFGTFFSDSILPADMPENLKELLGQPTNMWEFSQALYTTSSELSDDQKKFKELIKYLHEQSLIFRIYEALGIEGFDGEEITDIELFRDTFVKFYLKDNTEKTRYELFMEMHQGLELLGIVKGKPRKQKLLNLINDSRHGYFGGCCDILVTKDADFINKTKFMYQVWDVDTLVFTPQEFADYLERIQINDDSLSSLLSELRNQDLELLVSDNENGTCATVERLKAVHFGFFDKLTMVNSKLRSYYYFSRLQTRLQNSVLIKEVNFVLNQVLKFMGTDHYGKGELLDGELPAEKWDGRTWSVKGGQVELKIHGTEGLTLAFYLDRTPYNV